MTDVSDLRRWNEYLPTVEMFVNYLPKRSTGYSPFYLMYRYHPVLPVELLKGDESTNAETRGGQTFPKSTEFRNSIAFRPFFGCLFPCFSVVSHNRFLAVSLAPMTY